jgi:hypothetical protein
MMLADVGQQWPDAGDQIDVDGFGLGQWNVHYPGSWLLAVLFQLYVCASWLQI